jgi:hypothetical protein
VILSAPSVRKIAMEEISRWIDGYVQHSHEGVTGPSR